MKLDNDKKTIKDPKCHKKREQGFNVLYMEIIHIRANPDPEGILQKAS